jgi:hypothetical protein
MTGLNLKDPFSAVSSLESLFPSDDSMVSEDISQATKSSIGQSFYTKYLKLKEEEDAKKTATTTSGTADSFLGDFKSLFNL